MPSWQHNPLNHKTPFLNRGPVCGGSMISDFPDHVYQEKFRFPQPEIAMPM